MAAEKAARKPKEQLSIRLSKEVSRAVRQIAERRHVTIKRVLEKLATDGEVAIRKECEKVYQSLREENPAETALFPAAEH